MIMRVATALVLLALAVPGSAEPTAPLTYQVIRTSDRSFAANVVLLLGKDKAMLIDAPYTRADAHRVVAAIVVPGHEREGLSHDASGIRFTLAYIDAWQAAARKAHNSGELIAAMKRTFPDTIDPNDDFSLRTGARVTMGEEPKWDE